MPGQDADDDGREDGERVLREKARKKALLVENRFIQEARLYESDLRPLHGTLVPKFHGLWIGYRPDFAASWTNTYQNQTLLFIITEYLPSRYSNMIKSQPASSTLIPPSNISLGDASSFPWCPTSVPQDLWPQLPAGLRDCYLALQRVRVAHNAPDRKHWRGDAEGRWRILGFSKLYPEDDPDERPVKKRKIVRIDPRAQD